MRTILHWRAKHDVDEGQENADRPYYHPGTLDQTAYDRVPYPGHTHARTHPNRVAAVARLFGVDAPPVGSARVLEVACGDGANLIPIAYSLPRAQCAGFDLAASAVARAQERIAKLALKNCTITGADLETVGTSLGRFDYVIAHGLYSWVPRHLRDALLQLIRDTLSPTGIAFVSYNVYPGWHVAGMVRDMLRYHTRAIGNPATRIEQARALLGFITAAHDPDDACGRLLAAECERVQKHTPGHLFHDDLAEVNEPVYFHDFAEHAAAFGLQHLVDADFASTTGADLPAAARAKLEELRADPIEHGQYLDFVKCRRFRESLLWRAKETVPSSPVAGSVRSLLASSAALSQPTPVDLAAGVEVQFHWGRRGSLKTDHPLAKATLVTLHACWPIALSFEELLTRACRTLGRAAGAQDSSALESILLSAYGLRMVELTAEPWRAVGAPGNRPRASALARLEAEEHDLVTTHGHWQARIDEPLALRLLRLCDGTRDVTELTAELAAAGYSTDRAAIARRLEGLAKLALFEE